MKGKKRSSPYSKNSELCEKQSGEIGEPNKRILSEAGWSSSKDDDARNNALMQAIEKHGVESTLNALQWVANMHQSNHRMVKACQRDIKRIR